MNESIHATDLERYASQGSLYLSAQSDIEQHPSLFPYAHYLRQAWTEAKLSGVLCMDGRPTVYICEAINFTLRVKRERQKFVWNQGLVPLLVFLTPSGVEVHSTVKKPEEPDTEDLFGQNLPSLIPSLSHITKALELAKFIRAVETGQLFRDNAAFFPAHETVDQCLIENLAHTARRITTETDWKAPRAHALIGRALFVSFLQERNFIKAEYFPAGTQSLVDILTGRPFKEMKRLLYQEFFGRLKREFNGTMFDSLLADEEKIISEEQLLILRDFLSGADMKSGQLTLKFWAYDFRFIPVETISAIYEEFLKGDAAKKRTDGAYYTPRHLAETALHVALEDRYRQSADWRVLDPSCGSGIFLVAMFNLLSEQWLQTNRLRRKVTKAQALLEILQHRIRGVDIDPEACRIAAFSLYLALFEKLHPMDVDEFKRNVRADEFLPPLLHDENAISETPPVIVRGDFLSNDLPLAERKFDFIIGNPPWESRGNKQVALHFCNRTLEFLSQDGIGCLLLPTTILVNRHGTLDDAWFRELAVEKIVQLADFRRVLFDAAHPCFIMRYRRAKPQLDHVVIYETPKLNRYDRRRGVIVIESDDQKVVSQRDILLAALKDRLQSIWSRKFWGTPRDEAFLRRLDSYPRLVDSVGSPRESEDSPVESDGSPEKKKRWIGGVGFQPYFEGVSGKSVPIGDWEPTDNYLPNDNKFPHLLLTKDSVIPLRDGLIKRKRRVPQKKRRRTSKGGHEQQEIYASLTKLRRKPDERLFTPPLVVYSKGFSKFAFSERLKVRFDDGLRSISGPARDAALLQFLTAVLASSLVQYLTFHSGSNMGIGRDQLHVYESLNLPFLFPDDELAVADSWRLIEEAARVFQAFARQVKRAGDAEVRRALAKAAQDELEPLVQAYYSVNDAERVLIEDTINISQESIHGTNLDVEIPSLKFPDEMDRRRYADTLCHTLNENARSGVQVYAQGMVSKPLSLMLLTVIFGSQQRPYEEIGGAEDLWEALDGADKAARHDSGPFSYLRGFSYFERDRLHILKPATLRNWSRTAALNDADAIFEYLSERRK